MAARPSSAAPSFGRLLLAALRSVGVDYITLDHLRKAKKNALAEHECIALWRLLHDLVIVILLDFQVDSDALRCENAASEPSTPAQVVIWQELVRFYLYQWGFVCGAMYQPSAPPSASTLLLALAWLLARSQLVHRQSDAILRLYMGAEATSIRLPPYPSDVAIPTSTSDAILHTVATTSHQFSDALAKELDAGGKLHQIQALVGQIHAHQRSLHASLRAYSRLLARLEQRQRDAGADANELVSAYAAQLLARGKPTIDLHIRAIAERLAMMEDEKLFYKWVNGLLLQYEPSVLEPRSVEHVLATQCESLYREVVSTQQILQQTAPLFDQIAGLYAEEKSKLKAKTRTQQAKIDDKMARLRDEIATNELFDCRTLFLDRSDAVARNTLVETAAEEEEESVPLSVQKENLHKLQEQLQRVMREISTQYCHAELM